MIVSHRIFSLSKTCPVEYFYQVLFQAALEVLRKYKRHELEEPVLVSELKSAGSKRSQSNLHTDINKSLVLPNH